MEIGGRAAARSDRASSARASPGIMMQPSYTLPTMRDKEVAVPMSTMTMGLGYLAIAATEEATMSLPNWLWISALMFKPILMPGPTTMGGMPVRRAMASVKMVVSGGTTLERMAPSTVHASAP